MRYEIDTLKSNQRLFFETQFEIMRNLGTSEDKIVYFAKKYQNAQKKYHQKDHNILIKTEDFQTNKSNKHQKNVSRDFMSKKEEEGI